MRMESTSSHRVGLSARAPIALRKASNASAAADTENSFGGSGAGAGTGAGAGSGSSTAPAPGTAAVPFFLAARSRAPFLPTTTTGPLSSYEPYEATTCCFALVGATNASSTSSELSKPSLKTHTHKPSIMHPRSREQGDWLCTLTRPPPRRRFRHTLAERRSSCCTQTQARPRPLAGPPTSAGRCHRTRCLPKRMFKRETLSQRKFQDTKVHTRRCGDGCAVDIDSIGWMAQPIS